MRRSLIHSAFCVFAIVGGFAASWAEDADSSVEILPLSSEPKPARKQATPQPIVLPDVLDGVILDSDGNGVSNATVTIRILCESNPFDEQPADDSKKWTASTNNQGAYKLMPGRLTVEVGEEISLFVQGSGYQSLLVEVEREQAAKGKLSAQKLHKPRTNPWTEWKDDTQDFRAEVAIVVNGEFVLNGLIIDRYSGYLIAVREAMQKAAADAKSLPPLPTPQDFEKFRENVIQRELAVYTQKIMLVQYLMANLKPEERVRARKHTDVTFKREMVDKLQRELNASNASELELALKKKGTSLKNAKENFALDQLPGQCIALMAAPLVPISDVEIREYYELRGDQFTIEGTVDWRQISMKVSPITSRKRAREKLEQILVELRRGVPFDDVVRSHRDEPDLRSGSYQGVKKGSLADFEFASRLISSPIDQWSEILERRTTPVVDRPAVAKVAHDDETNLIDGIAETMEVLTNTKVADYRQVGTNGDGTPFPLTSADFYNQPGANGDGTGMKPIADDFATREIIETESIFSPKAIFGESEKPNRSGGSAVKSRPATKSRPVRPEQAFLHSEVESTLNFNSDQEQFGLHVFCVTSRRDSRPKPLEDAEDEIRTLLTKQQDVKRAKEPQEGCLGVEIRNVLFAVC